MKHNGLPSYYGNNEWHYLEELFFMQSSFFHPRVKRLVSAILEASEYPTPAGFMALWSSVETVNEIGLCFFFEGVSKAQSIPLKCYL